MKEAIHLVRKKQKPNSHRNQIKGELVLYRNRWGKEGKWKVKVR